MYVARTLLVYIILTACYAQISLQESLDYKVEKKPELFSTIV